VRVEAFWKVLGYFRLKREFSGMKSKYLLQKEMLPGREIKQEEEIQVADE
jgi:hypothetical protein